MQDDIEFLADQLEEFANRKLKNLPADQRDLVNALTVSQCIKNNIKPDQKFIASMRRTMRETESPILSAHMAVMADALKPQKKGRPNGKSQ